jgi:hypothetical protein
MMGSCQLTDMAFLSLLLLLLLLLVSLRYMEPECKELMMDAIAVNYIDTEE